MNGRRLSRSGRRHGVTPPGRCWAMQRCHAIAFSQSGEVKDMVNKGVNITMRQEPHLADMDQLGRAFPDDLYAKQALALWISDQLEEPSVIPAIWPRPVRQTGLAHEPRM